MKKIFTKAAVNKAARALTAGFLLVSSPLSHAEEGHKKTGHENVGQGVLVTLGTAVGIAGGLIGGLVVWGRKHDKENAKIPRPNGPAGPRHGG
ncbi:MAG: hypothetical protein H6853_04090 [Rhodospirillales bacterium]|nr:hypothetical protein [Alphaproteobacteria bacterium]USO04456.1 MAG: hypothetical protein H6853_04090 [Rhodospirillales bacterium]